MLKLVTDTVNCWQCFLSQECLGYFGKVTWNLLQLLHLYSASGIDSLQNPLRVICMEQSAGYREKHHWTFICGKTVWSDLKLLLLPPLKKKISQTCYVGKLSRGRLLNLLILCKLIDTDNAAIHWGNGVVYKFYFRIAGKLVTLTCKNSP